MRRWRQVTTGRSGAAVRWARHPAQTPAPMPAPQILRQLPDARVQYDPEAIRQRGSSGGHSARPPSAGTTAPVMALLAGLARKARTAATSVGSSSRRMGCWVANVAAAGRP